MLWNAVNEFNSTAFKLFELFTRSSATAEIAIVQVGGHYAVQSHSRSPVLVTIESPLCDLFQYNNTIQYKTCNVPYVTRMLFVGAGAAGMTRDWLYVALGNVVSAPLYLQTLWRYTNAVVVIIIIIKRWVLSLRLKTLTESQARMSYGRSFQFIAAECLNQRDDETVRM